jgi:hypothetical protein
VRLGCSTRPPRAATLKLQASLSSIPRKLFQLHSSARLHPANSILPLQMLHIFDHVEAAVIEDAVHCAHRGFRIDLAVSTFSKKTTPYLRFRCDSDDVVSNGQRTFLWKFPLSLPQHRYGALDVHAAAYASQPQAKLGRVKLGIRKLS